MVGVLWVLAFEAFPAFFSDFEVKGFSGGFGVLEALVGVGIVVFLEQEELGGRGIGEDDDYRSNDQRGFQGFVFLSFHGCSFI